MVDGAKRFGFSVRANRDDALARGVGRLIKKLRKRLYSDSGHVTGYDQVPRRGTDAERGRDAAGRAVSRDAVGVNRVPETAVAGGISEQAYRTRRPAHHLRHVPDQRSAGVGQERLIVAHPRAVST